MNIHVELELELYLIGYMPKCVPEWQEHWEYTFIKYTLNLFFKLYSTEKQSLPPGPLLVVWYLAIEFPF